MKPDLTFGELIQRNMEAVQALKREPEPDPVTSDSGSVSEYDRVLETNMTANYAAALDTIYRCRGTAAGKVIDLCSGPGHFAILLAKYLNYQKITGVDLSRPMVELANRNSKKNGLSNSVTFLQGDVTNLPKIGYGEFDLVTFNNAAHHMPSLEIIEKILFEAEKLAKPEGLIVLTDIARLKTKEITEDFVQLAGLEFKQLKMPNMFTDFRNSMFAAWLPDELQGAIPKKSKRVWYQVVPRGFTCFQVLIGLPEKRVDLYLCESKDWLNEEILQSEKAKADWLVLKQIIDTAEIRCFMTKPFLF